MKIKDYILGFLSALLSALSVIWVMNKTDKPTTEIKGKIKAKRGSNINLKLFKNGVGNRKSKRAN